MQPHYSYSSFTKTVEQMNAMQISSVGLCVGLYLVTFFVFNRSTFAHIHLTVRSAFTATSTAIVY